MAQAYAVLRQSLGNSSNYPSTMLRMVPLPIYRWGGFKRSARFSRPCINIFSCCWRWSCSS